VAVDCVSEIGFVEGEATRHLTIEWAKGAVHAYPIAESQTQRTEPALRVIDDSLQGYARADR